MFLIVKDNKKYLQALSKICKTLKFKLELKYLASLKQIRDEIISQYKPYNLNSIKNNNNINLFVLWLQDINYGLYHYNMSALENKSTPVKQADMVFLISLYLDLLYNFDNSIVQYYNSLSFPKELNPSFVDLYIATLYKDSLLINRSK